MFDIDTSKNWKPVLGIVGTLGQIQPFLSTLNRHFKLNISDSVDGLFPPGSDLWSSCDATAQGGILEVNWLNKLLEDWPAALGFCLQYDKVFGDPDEWNTIRRSLQSLKSALGRGSHPPGGILIILGIDELSQLPKDHLELLSLHSGLGKGSIFVCRDCTSNSEIDRLVEFLRMHTLQNYQKAGAQVVGQIPNRWHSLQQTTKKAILHELAADHSKSLYEYETSCSMIMKALAKAESLAESAMLLAHCELVFARMMKIYVAHDDLVVMAEKFPRFLSDCKVFVSSIDNGCHLSGRQVVLHTSAKLLYAGWLFRQYSNAADILIEGDHSASKKIYIRDLDPSFLYLNAAYSFGRFRALCEEFATKSSAEINVGAVFGQWLGSYEVNKTPVTTNEDFNRHILSSLAWKESQSEDAMIRYLEKAKMYCFPELENSKEALHRLTLIEYLLGKEYLHVGNMDLAKQYLIRSFRQYSASHWYAAALKCLLLLRMCFSQTGDNVQHVACSLLCSCFSEMGEKSVVKAIVSATVQDLQSVRETPITFEVQGPGNLQVQGFADLSLVFKVAVGWYRDRASVCLVFAMSHSLEVDLSIEEFARTITVITSDSDKMKEARIIDLPLCNRQRGSNGWIYWSLEMHQPQPQSVLSFQQSVVRIGPSAKLVISSAACNDVLPKYSADAIGQNITWSKNLPSDFCSSESIILQVPECIIKEELWPMHITVKDFDQSRPAMCRAVLTDLSANKNQCNCISLGLSAEEATSNQTDSVQKVVQPVVFDGKGLATVWASCGSSCSLQLFLSDMLIKNITLAPVSPVVVKSDILSYDRAEVSYMNAMDDAQDGGSKSLTFSCGSHPNLITTISNNVRQAIEISKASISWSNRDIEHDTNGPVSDVFPIVLNESQDMCQLSFRVPPISDPGIEKIEAELHLECRRLHSTSNVFSYRHPITATVYWAEPKVNARIYFDKESGPVGTTISMNLELHNLQVSSGLFTVEVCDSENFLIKGKKFSSVGCAVGSVAYWKVALIPHRAGYFPFPKLDITALGEKEKICLDRETSGLFVH